MFFTIGERIGERKGFIINRDWKKKHIGKLYVAEKKKDNAMIIAEEGDKILKRKEIFISNFRSINKNEKVIGMKFYGRIRHLGELNSGKLIKKNNKWSFVLDKGLEGVAEGQELVLYKGERLVGSGEIQL